MKNLIKIGWAIISLCLIFGSIWLSSWIDCHYGIREGCYLFPYTITLILSTLGCMASGVALASIKLSK